MHALAESVRVTVKVKVKVKVIVINQRHVSRHRLAKLVGYSASHVSLVFSGRRQPSVALVVAIAREFETTTDEVLRVISANSPGESS